MNGYAEQNEVTIMKRQYAFLILLSLLSLWGCAGHTPSLTTQTGTGAAFNASECAAESACGRAVTVDITLDSKQKTRIPDPATAGNKVSIILPDRDYNCKNCDYNNLCPDCRKHLFTDLSFAGFQKPVIVTSFAQKGNCLFLMVTNTDKTVPGNNTDWNDKNFLLMLDYGGRSFSRCKTDFQFNYGYLTWYDMAFTDLTGDGQDELAVSFVFNHDDIGMEIFMFDQSKHKLKKIFTNLDHNCANFTSFRGWLEDNYTAVLSYKDIGFRKNISLLDAGYKKNQLEEADAKSDDDPYWFVRWWNNGRLQKDGQGQNMVFLYATQEARFIKTKKGIPQIRLRNSVLVRHRSHCIGDMYTYFQYDEKTETIHLSAAKFMLD